MFVALKLFINKKLFRMKSLKLNQKEKLVKFSFLVAVLFGTLISCSDENSLLEENSPSSNEVKQRVSLNLREQIVVTETTTFVSEVFFNMGVTRVEVTRNNDLTKFSAITEKTFGLKGQNVDLAEYPVVLEGEFLMLNNSNSTMKLSISEDRPYIESSSYTGFVKDEHFDSLEFNVILFFMREITLNFDNKINSEQAITTTNSQGCSFWDTYYVYGTGGNRSVALANLNDEVSAETFFGGAMLGCRKIGGINSSCLWGDHSCIATQAFCCD